MRAIHHRRELHKGRVAGAVLALALIGFGVTGLDGPAASARGSEPVGRPLAAAQGTS